MNKYSVVNSVLSVVASANTLHMAKRAFYDEVKLNPDGKLILVDGNLDSYAIFRGGKVVAGRKWGAFVKSSYNVPKPKAVTVEAPKPLTYKESFAKWMAENELVPGDKVKVLRKCESNEAGWPDSWSHSMDKFVGKVCTVMVNQHFPNEVLLSYEEYGSTYYFPHFVLEVMPTVRRVCLDVIKQIKCKMIIANSGCTIANSTRQKAYNFGSNSAQDFVKLTPCKVCAKGALVVDWVKNYNNFELSELSAIRSSELDTLPPELVELFGKQLLDEIEEAFELSTFGWCDVNESRFNELYTRYNIHTDADARLIAIMQDVADGKF